MGAMELSLVESALLIQDEALLNETSRDSESTNVRTGRWARRGRRPAAGMSLPEMHTTTLSSTRSCIVCTEIITEPSVLQCCRWRVCIACNRRWGMTQALEQGRHEIQCSGCARTFCDGELPHVL